MGANEVITGFEAGILQNIPLPPKVSFILSSGVSQMSLGQRVSLTLSADMAYGDQGTSDGVIPGGATLIFDLEIIDIE